MLKRFLARFKASNYPITGPGNRYGFGSFRLQTTGDYDYRTAAGDVYDNSVVLMCIRWLSSSSSQARIVLEKIRADGKSWKEVKNHELIRLLNNPNRWYSAAALWEATILSDAVDGNGYWLINRRRDGLPGEFHYVPHWAIKPVSTGTTTLIDYYEYYPEGGAMVKVPYEDVVHFRRGIDPHNPRKGLSRCGAVLREVCTDNEGATYGASLLRNLGVPGVILSPKGDIVAQPTREQRQSLREQWRGFTSDMRGEPFIPPYPVDVNTPGFSPEQMVLDKVRSIPAGRVCGAFLIDPLVLHLPSDSKTYSNFEEAERQAMLHAMVPMLADFAGSLETQLFEGYQLDRSQYRLRFDTTAIQALQENAEALQDRNRKNWQAGGLTRAEYRDFLGLPFSAADDLYYTDLTAGVVPADNPKDQTKAQEDTKKSSASAMLARANLTSRALQAFLADDD